MITGPEADSYRLHLVALMGRLNQDRGQLEDEAMQGTGGEASGGLSDVALHPADLGNRESEEGITLGLLERVPELRGDPDLDAINEGVTIVWLR